VQKGWDKPPGPDWSPGPTKERREKPARKESCWLAQRYDDAAGTPRSIGPRGKWRASFWRTSATWRSPAWRHQGGTRGARQGQPGEWSQPSRPELPGSWTSRYPWTGSPAASPTRPMCWLAGKDGARTAALIRLTSSSPLPPPPPPSSYT
jgi:hypothetical protein